MGRAPIRLVDAGWGRELHLNVSCCIGAVRFR